MPTPPSPPVRTDLFVLTAENRITSGKTQMVLYGASSLGPVRVGISFEPFFFVSAATPFPSPHPGTVDDGKVWRSLDGCEVKKIVFRSTEEADAARTLYRQRGIRTFESDVRPRERFFMERRINGCLTVEGECKRQPHIMSFLEPTLSPCSSSPSFRICSLDIETSVSTGTLLSIGAHLTGVEREERRVFMRGEGPSHAKIDVSYAPDERSLLESFMTWFREADPDLVIGWNVIGFDLAFLLDRAKATGVPLRLGRDDRLVTISENRGRFSRAYVPGRVVLDGPQLLRTSFFSFESYSLEAVSREVLGAGKLIAAVENKAEEIERLFRDDKLALAEYNSQDTVLTTEIFKRLELVELTVRRSQLSGMLMDQVGMSTASFDHFFLPRLHDAGFVAPDVGDTGEPLASGGGYVMTPKAGIYDDVISLDFQSLYPSIIRTFFIDPLSRAAREFDPITTPSGHVFSRTKHILPDFIGALMKERKLAKEQKNAPLSQAVKILMNSFYGVMGSTGSRLYHPELPDAITGTGQWLLKESRSWLEKRGHTVIYGDTDSLFVKAAEGDTSGAALAAELTAEWKERLAREYGAESWLVLEFKKLYKKFLVPAARGGEGGAKKRYAGLVVTTSGEDLEFVGLEVVRSDWTKLARDFQVELYTKVFRGEPLEAWLRSFVDDVRKGRFDDKLVYRKRLHKAPKEYGSSPPPYVRAALQLKGPVREVRYVMTVQGPVPIELSPKNVDYEHYIAKQLEPVADSALELLGTSFRDLIETQQLKLF